MSSQYNLTFTFFFIKLNQIPFVMGKPLITILKECPNGLSQIEEVNQKDQQVIFKLFWQMLLNLSGDSEETTKLKGEIFDYETFESESPVHKATMNFVQITLFIFFGDFEYAADLAIECDGEYAKAAPGFFLGMIETFHR